MPEHLKALAVVLPIALTVFAFAGGSARAMAATAGEFERRRNLWLGITLAAFLAHNVWLFMLLAGIMLHIAAARDQNKVGLVFFVLLAVPPLPVIIPGVGGIQSLFEMNYIRLIALVVLLPALVREVARHSWGYLVTETPDKLFYLYMLLNVILLLLRSESMTIAIRSSFLIFADYVLFYVIASRMGREVSAFRSVFASYAVCAAILAVVGIFEFLKHWLLYSSLDGVLGSLMSDERRYLLRGDTLRALATTVHSIAFGYAMAVGIMLLLGLRHFFPKKTVWMIAVGLLGMGLIASYSRGPWLGALVGFVVYCLTGPHKGRNFARLALLAAVMAAALLATPLGDIFIYRTMTVDQYSTIDYRERLFWNSIETILVNPFFGSADFRFVAAMQEMIQGQGIIDIVNTYLSAALRNGLVGLLLFVGIFLSAIAGVWRRMKAAGDAGGEEVAIGRALLAALACILVTITFISSVSVVPSIYYAIAGLAVAYARGQREKSRGAAPAGAPRRNAQGNLGSR